MSRDENKKNRRQKLLLTDSVLLRRRINALGKNWNAWFLHATLSDTPLKAHLSVANLNVTVKPQEKKEPLKLFKFRQIPRKRSDCYIFDN